VAFKFLGDTTAERLMRRCDICGMLYAQDDSEGSFDDVPELAKEDDKKDAVTPARTPTKAANPKATKATKAKAKPRASAAKAKPRASARKAAARRAKKGGAVKKAVAVVDTKVAKPPAAKKKAAKKKKAPGLLIADFNIAPRTFATTSSMRARE
jgi:hypothetical protein